MTFKHTKDGMLTVENQKGDFILKNEFLGVLHELILEQKRVLVAYSNENDPRKDDDWFKLTKTEHQSQLELLERLKRMVY